MIAGAHGSGGMPVLYSTLTRVLLIGLLTGLHLLAPPAPRAEETAQRAIEQRLQDWTDDFNTGRVDKLCDLFAPDLIANYRGQPEKTYESLCAALQTDLTGGSRQFSYRLELNEIIVSGDMAAVRLIWHLTVKDRATGETFNSADRGIDIFRRQPDGKWRISRYIAYEIEDE
jgi:ketosteroid isomerase-like protein